MKATRLSLIGLLIALIAAGCSKSNANLTGPTPVTPAGPKYLLAGQSGAFFLLQCCLTDAIDFTNIDGKIDSWLTSTPFAERARTSTLIAFVWWQGAGDTGMAADVYAEKLRALIAIARGGDPTLPVRIIEIYDVFGTRGSIKEAQVAVAKDAGVELIPTNDLPLDNTGHLTGNGNATVKERLDRSVGR